jgi:HEAT repeat protein
MDALYAIGDTKEDSISYKTLRDVALDPKQPRELRVTALDALRDFKKFDVLPDFLQIASSDKDEDVQNTAINYISDLSGNKDRRVDALIKLFSMLSPDKKEQQETIFYTIADIGNDKAVDFLISVAKTSPNSELKRQAVYYLGNIGGEKARAALYDILKEN